MGGEKLVVAAVGVMSAVDAARSGKEGTAPEVMYQMIRCAFGMHIHGVFMDPTTRVVASAENDVYQGCDLVKSGIPVIIMMIFNEMVGGDTAKLSSAIPAVHVASMMAAVLERAGPRPNPPAAASPLPAASAAAASAPASAAPAFPATGGGTAAAAAAAAAQEDAASCSSATAAAAAAVAAMALGAPGAGESDTEAEWRKRLTNLVAGALHTKLPTYVDLNPRRLALPALLAHSGSGKEAAKMLRAWRSACKNGHPKPGEKRGTGQVDRRAADAIGLTAALYDAVGAAQSAESKCRRTGAGGSEGQRGADADRCGHDADGYILGLARDAVMRLRE